MTERRDTLQRGGRPLTGAAHLDITPPPISAASAAGIFDEGSRFGAYVIGPCIGHGGMARIYRAEHEGLCRQVALKVLTEGVEPGTEGRARFLREARIAAAIKHPNVVNIFDIGVENQIPYLVMELLVGQDLESLLASHGALSELTIIDIMVPVVAGLVAVHDAGVIHRDLKPANIFLSQGTNDEMQPKLLDFGISKAVGVDKMRLTSTQGFLMGTPLYMSPEALLGAEMTAASDQYSLGVVLYECATGVNPFISESVAETARRVTSGQFTPISEQPIRPSPRLQAIIERMMCLDPKLRFKDMRALGQELLGLAGQRTRITWGLTFGEVATAARARQTSVLAPGAAAVRSRSSQKSLRTPAWSLLTAGCVGIATLAAQRHWPAPQVEAVEAARAPGVPSEPVSAAATDVAAAVAQPASNVDVAGGQPPPAALVRGLEAASAPVPHADTAERVATAAVTPSARHGLANEPSAPRQKRSTPVALAAPAPRSREVEGLARQRPALARAAALPLHPPPEPPEWMIEAPKPSTRAGARSRVQLGTNDAPIFD